MEFGLQFIHHNVHENMSDADMLRNEAEIAILAEEVGMDFVQFPEHHFDPGYSMMPDNMQWISYLAGRTNKIKLGTGAIILPWHRNPTRVAERVIMCQILLGERFMLGFGRGLALEEYKAMGIDMNTTRGRFDQAAEIVLDILDSGVAEYDTEYFKQTRTEICPKPEFGYRDREFFSVAMSPPSAMAAADLGATMMSFVQLPWEKHHEALMAWRNRFIEQHPNKTPGAPIIVDFSYCHEDQDVVNERGQHYLSSYYMSVIKHYEFDGERLGKTEGYQSYQASTEAIRAMGNDAACQGFVDTQVWGTPEQIIEKIMKRVEMTGALRPALAVSYGGMPYDMVADSLRLIGEKVVPEVKRRAAEVLGSKVAAE